MGFGALWPRHSSPNCRTTSSWHLSPFSNSFLLWGSLHPLPLLDGDTLPVVCGRKLFLVTDFPYQANPKVTLECLFSVIVVFILSSLWWIRIRGLWKLPDGRDWLWGKWGLVLMGRAMLSKSLIQFFVDGWGCVPPCCLMWDQTVVEAMKIKETSFKRSHARTAALSALTLQQATAAPRLCQRLLDTHREVWVSLLWGHCSFLLGPGAHKVLFVPSKSVSPVLCKFYTLTVPLVPLA